MSTPSRDRADVHAPATSPASPPPPEVARGRSDGFGASLKDKVPVVAKELLLPFIAVTSLFFLWGVANDLTNPMVSAFKKVMTELSNTEATLVQFAFYGGYGTMAIPAALYIRRFSYKSGILVGLALYAIGAFLFYPAATLETYAFFLASLYILTFGLAFLETTANPMILSMGAPETATQRLNLAQAFNPIGSLSGMLVAQFVVLDALRSDDFSGEEHSVLSKARLEAVRAGDLGFVERVPEDSAQIVDLAIAAARADTAYVGDYYSALPAAQKALIRTNDLDIISTPYIGLGVILLVVMGIIAVTKFPKVTMATQLSVRESWERLRRHPRYLEGVGAQMFYVGAQIACWTSIFHYVDYLNTSRPPDDALTPTWYNMAAMVCFLLGRWLCTYLMRTMDGARLMLYFAIGGVVCCAGVIFVGGMFGLYSLIGVSLCMSLMFPTIYGIALDGMGDEAKLGSAGLVMAIVGGALLPTLQAYIIDIESKHYADILILGYIPEGNFSFIVPLVSLAIVGVFAYRSLGDSKRSAL